MSIHFVEIEILRLWISDNFDKQKSPKWIKHESPKFDPLMYEHPSNICQDISLKSINLFNILIFFNNVISDNLDLMVGLRESTNSLGFILWRPWMFAHNLRAIYDCRTKWWTGWLTDPHCHPASRSYHRGQTLISVMSSCCHTFQGLYYRLQVEKHSTLSFNFNMAKILPSSRPLSCQSVVFLFSL